MVGYRFVNVYVIDIQIVAIKYVNKKKQSNSSFKFLCFFVVFCFVYLEKKFYSFTIFFVATTFPSATKE